MKAKFMKLACSSHCVECQTSVIPLDVHLWAIKNNLDKHGMCPQIITKYIFHLHPHLKWKTELWKMKINCLTCPACPIWLGTSEKFPFFLPQTSILGNEKWLRIILRYFFYLLWIKMLRVHVRNRLKNHLHQISCCREKKFWTFKFSPTEKGSKNQNVGVASQESVSIHLVL